MTDSYCLLPADLREPGQLAAALEAAGLDPAAPTYVLSECVLVYMQPQHRWVGPEDGQGRQAMISGAPAAAAAVAALATCPVHCLPSVPAGPSAVFGADPLPAPCVHWLPPCSREVVRWLAEHLQCAAMVVYEQVGGFCRFASTQLSSQFGLPLAAAARKRPADHHQAGAAVLNSCTFLAL